MVEEQKREIFAAPSAQMGMLTAIPALLVYFVANHFGYPGKGRIAAFSIGVLIGVVATSRPMWNRRFLWPCLALMIGLHVVIAMFVPWSNQRFPTMLIAPFAFIDFGLMLGVIALVEKRVA